MTEMTGGEIVYEVLKAHGVDHVFGIVSVHNIPIYDAINRRGGIRTIDVRHEQGALHAADGYSRATGKLGVAITSTGPGATNGMTGLFEAGFASSRVLMITGQTETQHYGKGKGVLHEAERQLEMLRTVTRVTESPRSTQEIGPSLNRVIKDICTGRPQPGAIEISVDLQYNTNDWTLSPAAILSMDIANDEIKAAVELLGESRRVVILAGGGVIRAEASVELVSLAEAIDAPVFTTTNGRGSIPEDHPLSMGTFLMQSQAQLENADVLLAVGTRFQGGTTGNFSLQIPKLIHIDADPHMIGLNYAADVSVNGDAKVALKALLDGLNPEPGDSDFLQAMSSGRDQNRQAIRDRMGEDFESIMDTMREFLPRQGNIVRDATVPAYVWGNTLIPILEPKTSIHSTSAAIGPALPLAIGAALGSGQKTVIIQGDGGFMLNLSELATAAQFQVPIVILIFNDGGYGVLRRIQGMRFEGRTIGVDLATPDFAAVANAMGVKGVAVSGVDEFRAAYIEAMSAQGPVLLDIEMASLKPNARLF